MEKLNSFCWAFKRSLLLLAVLSTALLSSIVHADDFPVVVGRGYPGVGGIIPSATSNDRILLEVNPDSSYCCSIVTPSLADLSRFTGAFDLASNTALDSVANGHFEPAIPTAQNHPRPDATRWCIRLPIDNYYTDPPQRVVFPMAFGADGTASASNVKVDCVETTLFGNYNINATEYNILEVANRTQAAVAASCAFVSNLELGAYQRFDYYLNAWFGTHTRMTFGTLRIVHTAPPGGLKVSLSRYRIDKTSPIGIDLKGTVEFSAPPGN
jgi:hypothetical protein